MEDDDGLSNEGTALPESGTGENEHLDNQDADVTPPEGSESDAGVTGETEHQDEPDDPQRGPVPYDRFRTVNEAKKARDTALEARGLRYDDETQSVVEIAPSDDDGELQWDEPTTTDDQTPDTNVVYTDGFWQQSVQEMADDPTWCAIAENLGFDPAEAVHNEWAAIRNIARTQIESSLAQKAQIDAAETQARSELNSELKAIKADPEFSVSAKAVSFAEAEVTRFKDAGYTASQIKAIMPGIKAKAYYENRGDYVKAEAQRMVRGESARTVRLGGQSPEGEQSSSANTFNVTPEIRRMAASFGTDAQRLAAEVARIKGEDK